MDAWDVVQIALFLAAYAGVKVFQKWLRAHFVGQPREGEQAAEHAAPPSLLARAWQRVVEWDAALVEYLARAPPAAKEKKGN